MLKNSNEFAFFASLYHRTSLMFLPRRKWMRGPDDKQDWMFSYISADKRVPKDHPLRTVRTLASSALKELSPLLESLYAKVGRPSVAPERLLRALLLQVLYSVRSERLLMEQLDYNLLFRWFVGLSMDGSDLGRDCLQQEPRSASGGGHRQGFL